MKIRLFFVFAVLIVAFGLIQAQDTPPVELRFTWYNDGNEGEALEKLLTQFEEANPGIDVIVDTVAYGDLHTTLQTQVEAGDPPDLARITDVARFAGSYLDLSEYSANAEAYTENFPAQVLASLRAEGDETGIYGFPTQFTITAPFINVTLFEQAGIEIPDGSETTWPEWIALATEVAQATETPYAVAIEPRGHRFWGFSIPFGATYVNEDGSFTVDTEGFRAAAGEIQRWHEEGITPPEIWATTDLQVARDAFINGQVVLLYSGSFVLQQFDAAIGDTFDWRVIPNPQPEEGGVRTGIPGGAVAVAFAGTEHPEEVAMLMDFLSSADALRQFSAETLFIPGHLGLIEEGIEYPNQNDNLNTLLAEIPLISDQAYALQYSPYTFVLNPAITSRMSQVIAGELTLDDALIAIQEEMDTKIAEAQAAAMATPTPTP
ncbi:MAG: extracellular solute-binding protein [Anaerolineae bacterium]|jgi:alpha-1,4-digalacturonate transport system substrate-binding protein|nr:extracellular solute-binding protein [Anaerolineae bacterium]